MAKHFNTQKEPTPIKRSFDAARFGKTSDLTQSKNVNADLVASLETLRGRCRQIANNDPYVARAMSLWRNYIIGPTGIDLHVQSKLTNGALDKSTNEKIERAWAEFCELGNCTTDGGFTFTELCKIIIETMARDGEVFLIKRKGPRFGRFGYQLDLIPIEQFASYYTGINRDNGNVIFQSVEFNRDLRPVAYWLSSKPEPMNSSYLLSFNQKVPDIRVPAEDCFHLFERHYIGQVRGFPWICNSVLNLHHLNVYKTTELEMARIATLDQIYFTMEAGTEGISDRDMNAAMEINLELEPGQSTILPRGVKPQKVDYNNPNSNMPDFIKSQLKGVAAGLQLSYAALSSDIEGVTFANARLAALEDQVSYQNRQQWVIDHFLNPLYKDWLKYQILASNINVPFSKLDKVSRVKWTPRGFRSVNLVENARAAQMLNGMGLLSRTQLSSELFGVDWNETLDLLQFEAEELKKRDLVMVSDVPAAQLEQKELEEPTDTEEESK
jgi:lambda family phage portal protein